METIVKEINGKAVKIPMPDIVNYMQKLELTQDEAIELWLTDNDYMDNEEVDRLTQQAKDNKITSTIHKAESGERKKREVTKKENPTKEGIIKALAATLEHIGAVNIKITNVSKLVEFEMAGNNFKLDLIQKRQPKK
jgi:hypothetical protein